MKAGFVFEKLTKFTEDSDPIHDMGIGRIKLGDDFDKIVKPAMDVFHDVVQNLIGKTVRGIFDEAHNPHFTKDSTIGFTDDNREMTIKIIKIRNYGAPNMLVESEDGYSYVMRGDREYKIVG